MNITRGMCRAYYTTSMRSDPECCLRSLRLYDRIPIAQYDRHKTARLNVIWPGFADIVFEKGILKSWAGQNGHDKHIRLVRSTWSLQ